MTSDLPRPEFPVHVQLVGGVEQGGFVHRGGLPNGLGIPPPALSEMTPMPPAAASAPPGPAAMDTSPMPGVQNQGEDQAQAQPCKYDLLSSLPCEYTIPVFQTGLIITCIR